MARSISAAQAQAQMRAAARKLQREVDRVNRENKRRVEEYNREVNRVNQHNAQVARHNARVNAQLQQTNAHNQQVAAQAGRTVYEISRQLRSAGRTTAWLMSLARRSKPGAALIADATKRVQDHPYRRLRGEGARTRTP